MHMYIIHVCFTCIICCRSILSYWRVRNVFEYYDSAGSTNSAPARLCSNKLVDFLKGI